MEHYSACEQLLREDLELEAGIVKVAVTLRSLQSSGELMLASYVWVLWEEEEEEPRTPFGGQESFRKDIALPTG